MFLAQIYGRADKQYIINGLFIVFRAYLGRFCLFNAPAYRTWLHVYESEGSLSQYDPLTVILPLMSYSALKNNSNFWWFVFLRVCLKIISALDWLWMADNKQRMRNNVEGCGSGQIGGVSPPFEWMLVNNELQRKWNVALVANYIRICFEGLSKIKRNISYDCFFQAKIRTWYLSRSSVALGSISRYVDDTE